MKNCQTFFTRKELEDEVNKKGYLVKHNHALLRFMRKIQKVIEFTVCYPQKIDEKNHTCKEWEDKVNQKGYLTKHQKSKTRLISIVSKPIKAVFVLLLDVCEN